MRMSHLIGLAAYEAVDYVEHMLWKDTCCMHCSCVSIYKGTYISRTYLETYLIAL
jgi:hypothetical protein